MNYLWRRRARLLVKRTQPFADEPLVTAGNFTWLGNSMGAQPGVRGGPDLAGGVPMWTLIGIGATRLFIVESTQANPDRGTSLFGSWPLNQVQLDEQSYERTLGPAQLGAYRAIRFEFPNRDPAVLQPFGREVDALLTAHAAAQPNSRRPDDGLAQVALMATSRGPVEEDVFFVLTYHDGSTKSVPLGEGQDLLAQLQDLPGFDNETFIRAMSVTEAGMSVLWRANAV